MLKAIRPFRNQQEVLPAGKEVVKSWGVENLMENAIWGVEAPKAP